MKLKGFFSISFLSFIKRRRENYFDEQCLYKLWLYSKFKNSIEQCFYDHETWPYSELHNSVELCLSVDLIFNCFLDDQQNSFGCEISVSSTSAWMQLICLIRDVD